MNTFSAEKAAEVCAANYAPPDPAFGGTPPRVFFTLISRSQMQAAPEGAIILAKLLGAGLRSSVTITETDGTHIARVIVETPEGGNDTEEAIAIASALYWSWWRAWKLRQLREACLPGGEA
jgi:hypothetical protein